MSFHRWTLGGATFSPDRIYRHHLWLAREIDLFSPLKRLGVCMLNPSKAGEVPIVEDDQTIRKLRGFCQRWGYYRYDVVNESDFCATRPEDLFSAGFPVSPDCDRHIVEVIRACDAFLVAWGAVAHPQMRIRAGTILAMAELLKKPVVCIGVTKHGHPLHPVMAAYTDAPVPFDGAVYTARSA